MMVNNYPFVPWTHMTNCYPIVLPLLPCILMRRLESLFRQQFRIRYHSVRSSLQVYINLLIIFIVITHEFTSVVLPCCVFSRLFPDRKRRQGGLVSTYYELIDWLVDLHPAIRVTTLPFEGANIAVWATFQ